MSYAVQVKSDPNGDPTPRGDQPAAHDGAPTATPGVLPWWQPGLRTRRQPLDVERIVAAAIGVLDAGGDVEALSLRRLGTELGVAAASMYWHIPHKQALLDLVTDELLAELPGDVVLDPAATWRAQLADICRALRKLVIRHPAAASLLARRVPVGPNGMALMEVSLGVLSGAGFHGPRRVLAYTALVGYAIGQSVLQARPLSAGGKGDERTVLGEGQLAGLGRLLAEVPRMTYPVLFEVADDMARVSDEESFEYGLQRMLDGLEADLRGGATPRRRF